MSGKIERLSNIAITVMAVVITVFLAPQIRKAHATPPGPQPYKVGEKFDLPLPINFAESKGTLLMLVQSQCQYCVDSAPFYQRIIQARGPATDQVRLVAVSTDSISTTRSFLADHGVKVDDVVQHPPKKSKFSGTPTLVLVRRTGEIAGVWQGRLNASQEQQVMQAIGAAK